MASNVFRFDEQWDIPGFAPGAVYAVLADAMLLTDWWGDAYKEIEQLNTVPTGARGARFRAKARGALPYELNFVLESAEFIPGRLVVVKTFGDFDGIWRAELSEAGGGTRVDLTWQVIVERPILKLLSPLLRPAFAWNHRWTTPRGEAGLIRYLKEHAGGK
jgi:hypothetical protein